MTVLFFLVQLHASICAGPNCGPHPAAWTSLKPDEHGQYMVLDHGRWHWHNLQELFERD